MLESIFAGFVLGIMGSGHCIMMCGGIISSLSTNQHNTTSQNKERLNKSNNIEVNDITDVKKAPSKWLPILLYQLGRLSSYTVAGFVVGFLGSYFGTPLESKLNIPVLKIFSAILLILMGLNIAKIPIEKLNIEKVGQYIWSFIQPLSRYFLPVTSPKKAYLLGVVWGWLPCGLVYTSLSYAITTDDSLTSALFMFAFGVGTLPSVILISGASLKVKTILNSLKVQRFVGALFIISGFFLLWQIFQNSGAHMHH